MEQQPGGRGTGTESGVAGAPKGTDRRMSRLWLVGVAVVVGALVLASILVAALRSGKDIKNYPENTPEGTVQRYLQAVWADDLPKAYGYLSDELKGYCPYQNFRDTTQWTREQDMRVSLVDAEPVDGKTAVRVRVSTVSMGRPFTPEESSYVQSFTLLDQGGGAWRFAEPPWPMSYCPNWERENIPRKPVPAPA